MTTYEKIQAVLIEMGCESKEISPDASFVSLGLDSLDKVQLVIELEEALGVEILDDDLHQFVTVQNAVDYADSHRLTV